jgi:hypothetical protein
MVLNDSRCWINRSGFKISELRCERSAGAFQSLSNHLKSHRLVKVVGERTLDVCATTSSSAVGGALFCPEIDDDPSNRLLTVKAKPAARPVPERLYQGERSWMT